MYTIERKFKIGLIKETKTPPDKRVALPPAQAVELMRLFPNVEVVAQPSELRCFKDLEYQEAGIALQEDLSDCDLLIGIKEVKIPALIPHKTYLFFAHVAKKQPHNQGLFQAIARNKITLLDHEYITDKKGERLVAFGRWAGIVGAYNAMRARGIRTDRYKLLPPQECHDYQDMMSGLKNVHLRPKKILISGGGRVAGGALEVFRTIGIKEVTPEEYLNKEFDEPVLCRIDPWHYVRRKDGQPFAWDYWVQNPEEHESTFLPYTKVTDIFVACHYWDFRSPHFFTKEDMRLPDFKITVIADVSCDVPGPIPSTLRATTIAEPFYGYNPFLEREEVAFTSKKNITMMTVDNLPGALPRDASEDFAKTLIDKLIPHFLTEDAEGVIHRAMIMREGKLTNSFTYLLDYLEGKNQ
jgi:alanine dehydrogenase